MEGKSGRQAAIGSIRKTALVTSASLVALAASGVLSPAAAQTWNGSTSADWTVGSNWSTGTPPTGNVTINTNAPNPTVLGVSGAQTATINLLTMGTAAGTSSLTIQNGSTLSSVTAGTNVVGQINGVNATVTVTGLGSAWSIAGGAILGNGFGSTGTLNILDRATASMASLTVGQTGGGSGVLNVTGGGILTVTGNATMFRRSGNSTANISGTGSQWNVGGTLTVGAGVTGGSSGSGALTVDNGAVVSAAGTITIGGSSLSTAGLGAITVTGAGSQLSGGGALNIGQWGTGTLTVSNSAVATAGTVTLAGGSAGNGTLNLLSGGILASQALTGGAGLTRQVNFDGGTLRATAGNTAFVSGFTGTELNIAAGGLTLDSAGFDITAASPFTGVGALTKTGLGTAVLAADNAYTGVTNVNQGTLVLGNGGTTGSITSTVSNVTAGAVLGFNRSDAVTFAGAIQGAGSVQQLGAGTTILTAANTYSGGTTISAGTLQIGNGGTTGSIVGNVANNGTLGFNRSNALTFAGVISGTGSVRQFGTGTTTLSGINSYSGGTVINGGTLQVSSDANLGAAAGGLSFNNGTLQVTTTTTSNRDVVLNGAGTVTTTTNQNWTLTGSTSGAGSLTLSTAGIIALTGNAAHTGVTTISGIGSLQIGDGGSSGTIAGDIVDNATVRFNRSDNSTYTGSITGSGAVQQVGGGVLTFTGNSNYAGSTLVNNNSELRINGGNTVSSGGQTSVTQGGTLTVAGTGSTYTTASFNVQGSGGGVSTINVENGGLLKTTAGGITLRSGPSAPLAAANLNITGAGSLADLNGALLVASNAASSIANVTIGDGGALRSTGANLIGFGTGNTNALPTVTITGAGSNWTSTGTLAMSNGSFSLLGGGAASFASAMFGSAAGTTTNLLVSGPNSVFTTSGNLTVGTGTGTGILTLADGGRIVVGGTFILADNAGATGVLNIGGVEGAAAAAAGLFDRPTLAFGSATSRLNFNHNDPAYSFAALLSGTGTVNQTAGTTILTAANSYSGTTNVNGGTLRINGDQSAATGLTTVGAAGTLGGSGIIGGDVDMSAGGTLAPGNSPGTLTINGNLVLGAGTQLAFELGQAGTAGGALNDLVNVGGNLTLDGTVNVTQSAGGTYGPGIYRLFNYGGVLTNNGLAIGTMPAGAEAFVQTSVAGQVNLVDIGGLDLNFWDGAAGPKFDGVINGGTGIWQAHGGNDNWTDLSGAINAGYSDGAIAIFTGTAGTVTVDNSPGAVTASGMQFATSGYVITGDPVTLTGAQATIRVGDGSAASAGYVATIASALAGASQLVKADLGTLVLTGANTYTGGTRIDGGTLRIGNGGATGSITGDIVNNAALVVNRTGTLTLGGAISGTGTLTKTGSGTLTLGGANSYAGGTTISGGTVQVSSDANLGDVAGVLSLQGGTLQAGASFTSARNILVGSPTSNRIDTQGFDVTLTGTIGNGANNQAGNFLDKIGSGTLTLTGANIYANRTVISGGTLALAGAGKAGVGNIIVGAGTIFDISQTDTGARVIQLGSGPAGTIALGSKMLTLGLSNSFSDWSGAITDGGIAGGTGGSVVIAASGGAVRYFGANSYTGGTTLLSGSFELIGNGALYSGGAVAVHGGVFDIAGLAGTGTTIGDLSGAGGGAGAIALGGKALTFGTGNSTSFTGTIAGTGGALVKNGTGAFTLTGANSYTGTTSVNAGTLLVNGNQSAATGLTSVGNGATLGGSGIIGGDVFVADGGTLAPGNSPGTLTINGGLTLSGGSTLAYEFGARNAVGSPLNDLVDVGGNLTLDGTINVSVTPGGAFDIGLYRVANYGGTLTDNGLAIGTMPAGAELSVQTSVAGQVNLINTGGATLNFWDGSAGANKFNNAVDGGSGMWRTALDNSWTETTGAVNAAYDNGAFAIFAGTGGLVTIDNSLGTVTASGLQFATTNYRIQGDALTLTGPQSVIRVGDGTSAGLGYSAIITSEITGNTQLVKTDLGRLELTGTNSYTGGTALNGGTVRISSDANLGAASGGLSFNGGTLNTTADISSGRVVDLAGQGVFSADAGTMLTLTGNLTGTGLIGKLGAGTLVLAGTGSHTGGMGIVQGTLLVNGNYAAATGLVTMNQLTTLGGTGTIGGNVNLSGTLAPGANGVGTLTINGNLGLSQSATLAYEFGAANVAGGALNDLVNVGGNLVLDGTINVTHSAGGNFSAGIYRVFNYGGTLTDNGLTLGALPAGSNVMVQTSVAGQVNLVNFAGLTLNFWDGAAGPKNNGVINGGTGIWQNGTGNDNWADASGAVNAPYSDGAFAVFGGTAGTVTVDNSLGMVAASGMQFAVGGYTITGGSIALAGAQATARVGDGSTAGAGYTATINAALTGASQLVKTDAGTLVLGGTNSYTGGTLVTGGTVQIASDANLGAASGGITLDGGTLVTSSTLSSARNLVLQGAGTLSTATGTTFTLGGLLSGTGNLTKAGTGTLVLSGASAGYAGTTRIAAGTLTVTGVLGGTVNVDAAGRLEGTGTVGNVTNTGTIAPGLSGVGTLTLTGNYTGANGAFEIEAELSGDGARADRLVVGGATAGTTLVKVTNLGGTGAPTVEGIKIVDVAGASNGVFTLDGDYVFEGSSAVIAGAYGYRLYKNGVATPADGDWYLRSSLLSPVTPPTTPNVPLYQPGVPVYEAYGQTLATLNAIDTMQERVGNRRWSANSDGISGIWGRMESARTRPNAVRSTSLSDVNVDSWKVELGADQVLSTRSDGSTLVVGMLGSYGEASASIGSIFGNGSIKTRGYGAGATLSWFGPQGFYVDSRAQFTWFDSKLKSTVLGKLTDGNDGTGQAYSVEVGKRSPLSGTLSVTPQIQMAYSTVGFDRFTDPNGAEVSSRLGDSLKTRWGISLDRQDSGSHLYGVVNLSYEWLDGTVTQVSGTPIARGNERLWGEFGLGGSVLLGERTTLFSEFSANTAIHDFGKSYALKGVAGLRLAF